MIKKGLLKLVLVAICVLVAGTVQAAIIDGLASDGDIPVTNIHVNPGGLGDALIYGYYNVKNGNLNFLRVVNTSSISGVGAKIRFREGKNSNEVLDFFICLSARDQWSAFIVDGGSTQPAILYYWDNDTPTYPDPQRNDDPTDNVTATTIATEPFHYSLTGAASSVTANDTKEGYFEIIANVAWPDTPGDDKTVKKPTGCRDKVIDLVGTTYDAPNSLMGNAYIFNIAAGAGTYAYNATALADFADRSFRGSLANDSSPRLDDATETLNAVNFVLTKSRQYATYDLQFDGQTTIINTFPTKRLSIEGDPAPGNGPFNDAATIEADGTIKDRCETVALQIWDDAEHTPTTSEGVSPRPVEEQFQKCNEVSLIVVGSGDPVLTTDLKDVSLQTSGYDLGWIIEDLTAPGRQTTVGNATASGLPVISYELQGFLSGYLTHMLPLRYETDVTVQ